MPETAPHGTWRSPITVESVISAAVRLGDLHVSAVADEPEALWWDERRPSEGGRTQIVRRSPDGAVADVLPEGFSASSRVHEYGGGAWWLAGETVFFVNDDDQRIWRVDPGFDPAPVTPEPDLPRGLRYADGVLTPDWRWIICVQEVHVGERRHPGDRAEPVNRLVVVPAIGGEPTVLFDVSDFVSTPRLDPSGRYLAWVTWDHPAMPWDSTWLWVADLTGDAVGQPLIAGAAPVAGGEDESVLQPSWDHDGRLWYISDRTDWWELYHFVEPGRPIGPAVAVSHGHVEVGSPPWVFGEPRYTFLSDGRVVFAYTSDQRDFLAVVDLATGTVDRLEVDATSVSTVVSSRTTAIFIGASFTKEASIEATLVGRSGAAGGLQVLRSPRDMTMSSAYLSAGQPLSFPTGDGSARAHALYYPPANPDFVAPKEERPPLVVMIHGGPTSMAQAELRLSVQFWTSRGFAVVDVNHRGSTGFGRHYRNELRGRWGVVDVEDCEAAARFLAEGHHVDPDRMVIRGASAGGYTALAALTFTDTFAAGASIYGIADLTVLATDTHKFEARYMDSLVGPWPEAEALYVERSPLHHIEQLARPVIVMQGLDDRVVPPKQAELIVEQLALRGVPHTYLPFEGEGHGFRKAATIRRALEAELSFYAQVLGFDHPDDIEPVEVVGR
jgi:dipeptidyl aminopeptidase/acylaminoacyl peptidase